MRRDEIILLATIYRHQKNLLPEGVVEVTDTYPYTRMRDLVTAELVPSLFSTPQGLRAVAAGTIRTGYLHDQLVTLDSESIFVATPLLDEVMALAPFEVAMATEEAHRGPE